MKIKLINHASILVDTGDVKILTDPWLSGSAFDDGWDLLVSSNVSINDIDFDYIWISHEHPDHFSISDLKKLKNKTKFIYQDSPDGKVRRWLEDNGHEVVILKDFQTVNISSNTKICCSRVDDDSWVMLSNGDKTLLNLNDCNLNSKKDLEKIKNKIGKVDVLLTQFSFANWVGNKNDNHLHKQSAELILNRITNQGKYLNAEYIIPFASFVRFSHIDNSYLNNSIVTVDTAVDYIKNTSKPIVLFIDETWKVGSKKDNKKSISKWFKNGYDMIPTHNLHKPKKIDIEILNENFIKYVNKIKNKNSFWLIKLLYFFGCLPSTIVYLEDLKCYIEFNIASKFRVIKNIKRYDISMKSESLLNIFKFEWGRGTLTVNARFNADYNNIWKFFRQTKISYANNVGKYFPRTLTFSEVLNSYKNKWLDE